MRKRTVTDIAFLANGNRAASHLMRFNLDRGSYTAAELVLPVEIPAPTNHLGQFSAELWCNADGEVPTRWVCALPDGEIIRFVLEYGDGSPITLRELRTIADAVASSHQELFALLDQRYVRKED